MAQGKGGPGGRRPAAREILDDPDAADRRLRGVRARHGLPEDFPRFVWERLSEVPDPDRAVRNLESLAERIAPPADSEHLIRLLHLIGASQFLADVLLKHPDFVAWLAGEGSLEAPRSPEDLAQELARFHFRAGTEDDRSILRRFKDRELLRIALRDYLQVAEVAETTDELSDLADVLLEKALNLAEQPLLRRFGRPQCFDSGGRLAPAGFAVIGLGKLGGRELNYSSDVDLLFLFSDDGDTSGETGRPGSQIANREWFRRLAEGLVERIGGADPGGRVFRIDMELRPGGRDGELVQSLRSALAYYQVWGRGWERQALLKARGAAGSDELAGAFLRGVAAIVHDRPGNGSFAAEAARIHRSIHERMPPRERDQDVKRGSGGIRELEIAVQALQLFHSGGEPWLREGNTLRALHRLSDKGLISGDQHSTLARAYAFLRRVEHRLQLRENRQTFRLPEAVGELRVLARTMGYRDDGRRREGEWFLSDLGRHRAQVRGFFESVLGEGAQPSGIRAASAHLFFDAVPEGALRKELAARGFSDPEKTLRPLNSIRKSLLPYRGDAAIAEPLARAEPDILRVLAGTVNPFRGWRNLDLFLASLARTPDRFRRFVSGGPDWMPLVDLLARSNLLADLLIHRAEEIERLDIAPRLLVRRSRAEMVRAIREACRGAAPAGGPAAALCRVRRQELLRIGFRDLLGGEGPASIRKSLSDLADAIIGEALWQASREVYGRHRARRRGPEGFAVLGLGGLATREIGYRSDLDLVLVRDRPAGAALPFHQEHRRVGERFVELLSTITQHGFLYAVDLRLRPSGGEGELVPTLAHLLRYFDHGAEMWERQSFLRLRPVAGDGRLAERATQALVARLFADLPARAIAKRIAETRDRLEERAARGPARFDLKRGRGGILDVLFLVQYLQLTTRDPRLACSDSRTLLAAFRRMGILREDTFRSLQGGYRFLQDLDHVVERITGRRTPEVAFTGLAVQEFAVALGWETSERLLARLAEVRHEIRRAYESIVLGRDRREPGAQR